jgi:glycosyltransferase involved in cell wall biosynthesis
MGQPLQAWYAWSPELARQIRSLAAGKNGKAPFDVVHVEHLRGVRYGLELTREGERQSERSGDRIPVVWDSVDCISHLFRQSAGRSKSLVHRFITQLELGRTEKYEGGMITRFHRVMVTSQQDKDALISLSPTPGNSERVVVIPNGVDLDYFSPDPEVQRKPDDIVISGKMSYHANITMVLSFVESIWPLIVEKRPGVRLWVVGKDPSKEIQALSRHENINVTGTVSDMRPYLRAAAVSVAPLVYGAGIQNKVLESMACGTPVVAAPGAIAALQAEPGKHLLTAHNANEFAEQTIRLLTDEAERTSIGAAGRDYVMRNHHWDRITEKLEEVYRCSQPNQS